MSISILDSRFCVWVVESLGHVLWQGCALTALAMLTGHALRNRTASARYNCYCIALLLTALALPMNLVYRAADLTASGDASSTASAHEMTPTEANLTLEQTTPGELATQHQLALNSNPHEPIPTYTSVMEQSGDESSATDSTSTQSSRVAASQPVTAALTNPNSRSWQRWSVWIVASYVLGMLAMTLRLACGIYGSGRLKSGIRDSQHPHVKSVLLLAKQLRIRTAPMIACCDRVATPVVVGLIRPTILVPASILSELSAAQVESLLLHELAHIRRYDHIMNFLQRVIESLLFFHPGVWWLSQRIGIEREHCCDDLVLTWGSEPCNYAESLVRVSEIRSRSQNKPQPSMNISVLAADGRQPTRLRIRVQRILGIDAPGPQIGLTGSGSLLVIGLLLVAATVTATQSDKEPTRKRLGKKAASSKQDDDKKAAAKTERVRNERRKQLVGLWIATGATAIELNIQADGKYQTSFHRAPEALAESPESGVWILDGKSLIREVLKSPVDDRVGLKLTHRIKRLDAKTLRLESSDGARLSFVLAKRYLGWTSTDFSLRLALASDEPTFAAGDRVTLQLSLQNRSSRKQKVKDFTPLLGWAPRLFDNHGREIPYTIPAIDIGVQSRTTVLAPHQTATLGKYAFRLPTKMENGTYSVTQFYRIRVDSQPLELTSNPIQLRIGEQLSTAPKNSDPAKAAMEKAKDLAAQAEIEVAQLAVRQAEAAYARAKLLANKGFLTDEQLLAYELDLAAQEKALADRRSGEKQKQASRDVSAAELLLLEADLRRATAEHKNAVRLAERGFISKQQLMVWEHKVADLERRLADLRAAGVANLRLSSQRYSQALAESKRVQLLVNRGLVPQRQLDVLNQRVAALLAERERIRAHVDPDRPTETPKAADKNDMVRAHYPDIAKVEYGMSDADFRKLMADLELPLHPTRFEDMTKYVLPTSDGKYMRFVFDKDQLNRIQRVSEETLPAWQGKTHQILHQNHVVLQLFYSQSDVERKTIRWSQSQGKEVTPDTLKETFQSLQKNGLQVEPFVEIQASKHLAAGDVTNSIAMLQQAGFQHIRLTQLLDATYLVLPFDGEAGSIHGEIRETEQLANDANYQFTLLPEKWKDQRGKAHSLKMSKSGDFEVRNVPIGKCIVVATAIIPTEDGEMVALEKRIECSVQPGKTTRVVVDFKKP